MKEWHKYFENSNGSSANNPNNGDGGKKGQGCERFDNISDPKSIEFVKTRKMTEIEKQKRLAAKEEAAAKEVLTLSPILRIYTFNSKINNSQSKIVFN